MKKKGKLWKNHDAGMELLWLAKGPPWDEATLNSGKIKPVALAIL